VTDSVPREARNPSTARDQAGRRAIDRTALRLVFLVPGAASLVAGLYAALLLLGLTVPAPGDSLADSHGILMVVGFVGTLIVLERAVAVKRWWAFSAPALLGVGSLLTLAPVPAAVGRSMVVLGAAGLLVIYAVIWRRQAMTAVAVQTLGAVALVAAALLWLAGLPLAPLVPSFTAFLVLTIVGERLELARVAILDPRAGRVAFVLSVSLLSATLVALLWPGAGFPLLGIVLVGLVMWLARYDVAFRTVRAHGLTRFMAVCLLAGYAWLLAAAGIWIVLGPVASGPAYDAALHSVFLGFTMSMNIAHAPVILPAVLRRPLPYRPVMIAPVVLLHASLIARIVVGDGRGLPIVVQWGGVANELALLLFVALAAFSVLRGPRAEADRRSSAAAAPASLDSAGEVGRADTERDDAAP